MIRRFATDRRGSIAVEFALVAPFLVSALLGAIEAFGMLQASAKVMAAAYSAADLIAQPSAQTDASMGSIVAAAQDILVPLPNGLGSMTLNAASIGYSASTGSPMTMWTYTTGGGSPVDITQAAGLGSHGDSVIEVTVTYAYTPLVVSFTGPVTFTETALSRPRHAGLITYNGKVTYP
jgi:Flp pilus assembly protein TadG